MTSWFFSNSSTVKYGARVPYRPQGKGKCPVYRHYTRLGWIRRSWTHSSASTFAPFHSTHVTSSPPSDSTSRATVQAPATEQGSHTQTDPQHRYRPPSHHPQGHLPTTTRFRQPGRKRTSGKYACTQSQGGIGRSIRVVWRGRVGW